MTRTLFLFLAWTAAFPWSALAQCDFQSVYRGAYRSTALDVAVDGADLWEATSFGVLLYDRGTAPPMPRTSVALPGTTSAVQPVGGTVYAASDSSIFTLRRNGSKIVIAGTVNVQDTIYDLHYIAPYLYAGTSKGIVQLDLLDPSVPLVINRLATSAGPAFSLAGIGSFLYAADGDGTVDVYTLQIPALPQKVGAFAALFQNTAVHAVGDRLYVSDGVQTRVFFGGGPSPSSGETSPSGSTSFFNSEGSVVFMAGADRTLRAIDYADPFLPLGLLETTLPASFGTVNRITAIAGAEESIYVAAGDAGLITFDVSQFRQPFPLLHNPVESAGSLFSSGDVVISATVSGGLRKYQQSSGGALSLVAQWDGTRQSTVFDGSPGRALTGSGSLLTLWSTTSSTPSPLSSVVLSAPVASAVLVATTAWAVLTDHTLWKVDMSVPAATAIATPVEGSAPSYIARGGTGLALADLTGDGKTILRYFSSGDLTSGQESTTVDGAAAGGIALSADGRVAVVTFRGLQLANFRSSPPSVTVVPQTASVTSDLLIEGNRIALLLPDRLDVRDLSTGALQQTFAISSGATSISLPSSGPPIVSVAGGAGITSVNLVTSSKQPQLLPAGRDDRYFRKLLTDQGRLHLFDGRRVDSYLLSSVGLPSFIRQITPAGSPLDVAAAGDTVWEVTGSGDVLGYSLDGTLAAEYQIDEGSDVIALSVRVVAGAVYASVNRGCLSGGCEKKTIILQQSGNAMIPTSSLPGATLDVAVDGDRAYAIFEGPDEIRILDLRDPWHPAVMNSLPSEGKPVSIAHSQPFSAVYAIGQKLYAYDANALTKKGELLDPYQADPSRRLTYLDQSVHLVGGCAIVAGRAFQPQLFRIDGPTNWISVPAPPAAAAGRSVAVVQGRIYLLTDYSLEIWSTQPLGGRRRP